MSNPSTPVPAERSSLVPWLLLAVAVAAIIIVGNFRQPGQSGGDPENHPGVGQRVPDLHLQPLTGGSHALSPDDLAGHVVLLNFWGTWCGPCEREFPHIVELAHRFAGDADFLPVLVSCGQGTDNELDELREDTRTFLNQAQSDLPTYADQGAITRQQLGTVAGMEVYPFTVLLDRQGIIRAVWDGYLPGSETQMEKLIAKLLAAGRKSK